MVGAAKLVVSIGGAVRANREHICVKIDLKNAFNKCSKAAILKVLEAEDSLDLVSFAATVLAPDAVLESSGEMWGVAEDGVVLGGETTPAVPSYVWLSSPPSSSWTRNASRGVALTGVALTTYTRSAGQRWCCQLY